MSERFFPIAVSAVLAVTAAFAHAVPPDAAAFLQRLESLRKAKNIPGLSVAVVDRQRILLAAGLRYADPQSGRPATAQNAYDIASVSKPLSAVVALRLAEDGVVDLDRPISEYSGWRHFCLGFSQQPSIFARNLRCDPAVHTLRQLLSHTAGGVPGAKFSYNPILFSWASRPMSAAAGVPFSQRVATYVFEPAEMRQSARIHRDLPLRRNLAAMLAPRHRSGDSGGMERSPDLPPQGDGAAGGVIATVLDRAKFDLAFDGGRSLSAASRDAMTSPTHLADGGNPLDHAKVQESAFARAFLDTFRK